MSSEDYDGLLDTCGLLCPMPLLKLQKTMKTLESGKILKILATDSGTVEDFKSFTKATGNTLLKQEELKGVYFFWIRKK